MTTRIKPYDQLPGIISGTRPRVLLVGNGINLSFPGSTDTESIIIDEYNKNYGKKLAKEDGNEIWKLPFPLQVVVATKDHVQGCMSKLAASFKDSSVSPEQKVFIEEILQTGFDAVLTTNYSLEFEKSTIDEYSEHKVYTGYKTTRKQTTQQKSFGIFQCTELNDDNRTLLWHIHGTALRKASLIMGQFYYGKLLSEVAAHADKVNKNYQAALRQEQTYHPESWIDYFLIGDVYIMGFRLDLSEVDMWWLLSYKKNAFPQSRTIFYSQPSDSIIPSLFSCYDILTPQIEFHEHSEDAYIEYYKRVLASI